MYTKVTKHTDETMTSNWADKGPINPPPLFESIRLLQEENKALRAEVAYYRGLPDSRLCGALSGLPALPADWNKSTGRMGPRYVHAYNGSRDSSVYYIDEISVNDPAMTEAYIAPNARQHSGQSIPIAVLRAFLADVDTVLQSRK